MSRVLVIGAGSWGTALAIQAARAGHDVTLWARDPAAMLPDRTMKRLPGHALPESVTVTGSLAVPAELVLLVVPMQHLRGILSRRLAERPGCDAPLVACCKGVERGTFLLPGEILAELASDLPHASLSGPNFAGEIAAGLPAASVLACRTLDTARDLASALSAGAFRIYAGADPLGVEVGAAAKNVIAIAAGAAIGAGFGENARAALVTRGIAELSRLIVALGGQAETASGLSGVGDLVLTCTGPSSRNFSLGVALGQGQSLSTILGARSTVAEGVETAPALSARARSAAVSVPIIDTVAALLTGRIDLDAARDALLNRPLATE